mmetsp:Transcript_26468/g.72769  ORF Transcript_26468/g.72769 Transcript_26468/m.72769 type:complete len:335 (-) Transcript_26468:387-1391(-)
MGNKFSTFEKNLPRVDGKVFVITGTTSGTGYIAAKTAAQHGGDVFLLNRPSGRAEKSLAKLREEVPGAKVIPVDCDLQDFDSVRNAVRRIKGSGVKAIYCLCNNAGIMAVPDEITKDGYDKQIQTNHLSHFLLTAELYPLLKSAAHKHGDARIVQHSSGARHMTPNKSLEENYFCKQERDGMLGGSDDNAGMFKGGQWFRYHQSKLANSVFTHTLQDRLSASSDPVAKNILSLCAHPGGSRTNLFDHLQMGFFQKIVAYVVTTLFLQSAADGSMGILKCMMDPPSELTGGTLYGPKGMMGYPVPNPPKPYEVDQEAKDMLWRTSEKATGVVFKI